MAILILFVLGVIVYALATLFTGGSGAPAQSEQSATKPSNNYRVLEVTTTDEPEDTINSTYYTYIAGVNYHNNKVGGFLGVVAPEPNNPHDPNAIAIYNQRNAQLVGYIAKSEQNDFRAWSNGHNCTCVGYIKKGDGEYPLMGRIHVIYPYNEDFVRRTTQSLIISIANNHGEKYRPK